jgi:tRNA1(Val) A37 N6-methylase TrmN6
VITGLELQEEMVERAVRGVVLNGLESRVKMIQGDVRSVAHILPMGAFDAVVCNPPFRQAGSGRANADGEKRIARHEIKVKLADFISAGAYLLRRGGRMALVCPATRSVELLRIMSDKKIEPKRMRMVHAYAGSAAILALVEGVREGKSGLAVLPPLVVYKRPNALTREVGAMLGEPLARGATPNRL